MAYGFTYTLPTITGSHTDLPIVLKTADFPAAAIDGGSSSILSGGGNLRAYTSSAKTTQLPVDIPDGGFVAGGTPHAEVWVKIPSAYTGATIYIEADDTETVQPAVTNAYGRNAVWSARESHNHFSSLSDSAGNADLTAYYSASVSAATGQGTTGSGSAFGATDTGQLAGVSSFAVHFVGNTGVMIGTGTNYHRILNYSPGVAIGLNTVDFGVWNNGWTSLSFAPGNNADIDIWLTYDGSTYRLYSDGVEVSTASKTQTTASGSGGKYVGNIDPYDTSKYWAGSLDELAVLHSTAAADLIATEYANQSATSAWGTVGSWADSGGDTTVNAAVKTFTLTTYPAAITTPSADTNVQAAVKALTLTTHQATVSNDVNIQAGLKALSLTTYAADISVGVNVSANTKALSLVTYPASIAHDVNVLAAAKSLSLTTYQTSVANPSSDVNVNAASKAFALTTYPATVDVVSPDTTVNCNVTPLTLVTYKADVDGVRVSGGGKKKDKKKRLVDEGKGFKRVPITKSNQKQEAAKTQEKQKKIVLTPTEKQEAVYQSNTEQLSELSVPPVNVSIEPAQIPASPVIDELDRLRSEQATLRYLEQEQNKQLEEEALLLLMAV